MRALFIAAAGVIAAFLLGFAQSTASAAPPVAVTIQIFPSTFFPVQAGTWEASGAINDSGPYVRTDADATGSLKGGLPIEHTGAFKEVFVLTGSQGTLTVKAEERLTPSGGFFPNASGVWQVVSGTGSYDGISGHGTAISLAGQFPIALTLTGKISKAG